MSNELAEKIKSAVKLRDVMEFYGVKFNSRDLPDARFMLKKLLVCPLRTNGINASGAEHMAA